MVKRATCTQWWKATQGCFSVLFLLLVIIPYQMNKINPSMVLTLPSGSIVINPSITQCFQILISFSQCWKDFPTYINFAYNHHKQCCCRYIRRYYNTTTDRLSHEKSCIKCDMIKGNESDVERYCFWDIGNNSVQNLLFYIVFSIDRLRSIASKPTSCHRLHRKLMFEKRNM